MKSDMIYTREDILDLYKSGKEIFLSWIWAE